MNRPVEYICYDCCEEYEVWYAGEVSNKKGYLHCDVCGKNKDDEMFTVSRQESDKIFGGE